MCPQLSKPKGTVALTVNRFMDHDINNAVLLCDLKTELCNIILNPGCKGWNESCEVGGNYLGESGEEQERKGTNLHILMIRLKQMNTYGSPSQSHNQTPWRSITTFWHHSHFKHSQLPWQQLTVAVVQQAVPDLITEGFWSAWCKGFMCSVCHTYTDSWPIDTEMPELAYSLSKGKQKNQSKRLQNSFITAVYHGMNQVWVLLILRVMALFKSQTIRMKLS